MPRDTVELVIIVLMGVSGSGKSAIGAQLAAALGWEFLEGDLLHPPANIEKLSSGIPLSDTDRAPWLSALVSVIRARAQRGENAVLSCSALKAKYREVIRDAAPDVQFVWLKGSAQLIADRLKRRVHFMNPQLLHSQLETLEPPHDALEISIEPAPEEIVRQIIRALALPPPRSGGGE